MRKNRSKHASKRYPNLYAYPDKPHWVYRKFSAEKKDEFYFSTGLEKVRSNEAPAYKKGVEEYNKWLGSFIPTDRKVLVRDIANSVLVSKESKKHGKKGKTYKSAKEQIIPHIIPAFGHLRPDQITPLRWEEYDAEERRKGRNALANTRKFLREILKRAYEERLIDRIPDLKNNDPEAEPPKYLQKHTVRALLHEAPATAKLWMFVMAKQGARPTEILQYRWDMINWDQGKYGMLHIPGPISKTNRARSIPLNSRVSRVLKWIQREAPTWNLDKKELKKLPVHIRRARRYLALSASSEWIFPSDRKPGCHMVEYKKGFGAACGSAGVDAQPYNLRDTWITDCLKRGLSETFIGRYCDNSPQMIAKRYAVPEQEIMEKVAL